VSWTDKYMAVPFRDGGRGWKGADCLGLYLLVLATELSMRLDGHADVSWGRDAGAVVARMDGEIAAGRWVAIAEGDGRAMRCAGQRFDAIRMAGHIRLTDGQVIRGDVHMGVALGDGRVLHTEPGIGPQILAIDDPRIVKRVRGVYRPAALAARNPATSC
jgi:cell wall-associated NlpC family hydrolase